MTKYTKQQAISIIIDCAAKYEENLNGYQLLFILKDKHKHISSLEVSFYPYNFLHLTGIKLIDGTTANLKFFHNLCLKIYQLKWLEILTDAIQNYIQKN